MKIFRDRLWWVWSCADLKRIFCGPVTSQLLEIRLWWSRKHVRTLRDPPRRARERPWGDIWKIPIFLYKWNKSFKYELHLVTSSDMLQGCAAYAPEPWRTWETPELKPSPNETIDCHRKMLVSVCITKSHRRIRFSVTIAFLKQYSRSCAVCGAYAPDLWSICCRALEHMLQGCGAYTIDLCSTNCFSRFSAFERSKHI